MPEESKNESDTNPIKRERKPPTDKQLAHRKAFGDSVRAYWASRKAPSAAPAVASDKHEGDTKAVVDEGAVRPRESPTGRVSSPTVRPRPPRSASSDRVGKAKGPVGKEVPRVVSKPAGNGAEHEGDGRSDKESKPSTEAPKPERKWRVGFYYDEP